MWGHFALRRENINGGVRFTMPTCPNSLAWTVTTGFPPSPERVVVHCTINRTEHDPDFIASIEEFVALWVRGLEASPNWSRAALRPPPGPGRLGRPVGLWARALLFQRILDPLHMPPPQALYLAAQLEIAAYLLVVQQGEAVDDRHGAAAGLHHPIRLQLKVLMVPHAKHHGVRPAQDAG